MLHLHFVKWEFGWSTSNLQETIDFPRFWYFGWKMVMFFFFSFFIFLYFSGEKNEKHLNDFNLMFLSMSCATSSPFSWFPDKLRSSFSRIQFGSFLSWLKKSLGSTGMFSRKEKKEKKEKRIDCGLVWWLSFNCFFLYLLSRVKFCRPKKLGISSKWLYETSKSVKFGRGDCGVGKFPKLLWERLNELKFLKFTG